MLILEPATRPVCFGQQSVRPAGRTAASVDVPFPADPPGLLALLVDDIDDVLPTVDSPFGPVTSTPRARSLTVLVRASQH